MSRFYEMQIAIRDHAPEHREKIIDVCCGEWFEEDDFTVVPVDYVDGKSQITELRAVSQSYLTGGEAEEEFAERITHAVWEANGGYCTVEIAATYLEDLPHEFYSYGEEDYREWKQKDE